MTDTVRITYLDGSTADIAEDALLGVDCMLVDECREVDKADAPDAVLLYAHSHDYGDRFVVLRLAGDSGSGVVPVPLLPVGGLRGGKAVRKRGEAWVRVSVESWEDEARRLRAEVLRLNSLALDVADLAWTHQQARLDAALDPVRTIVYAAASRKRRHS